MTIKQQKEYYNLHVIRTIENLKITPNDYKYLKTIGNKLNKIYTRQCNGYYNPYNEKWNSHLEDLDNKAESKYTLKASDYAKDRDLYIYFQTDPRGATIYIDRKPIKDTSYNNAYCIY